MMTGNPMTTDETAARLGELMAKSTPGEWEVSQHCKAGGVNPIDTVKVLPIQARPLGSMSRSDGELVALMKNALPALLAEREAMKAEIARLRGGLRACAIQFRYYQDSHKSKGTSDGDKKAATNADFAEMAERLLAAQPLPPGDGQ